MITPTPCPTCEELRKEHETLKGLAMNIAKSNLECSEAILTLVKEREELESVVRTLVGALQDCRGTSFIMNAHKAAREALAKVAEQLGKLGIK